MVLLEEDGDVRRLAAFSTSLQQAIGAPAVELHRAVLGILRDELTGAERAIPGFVGALPADVTINGAGDFAVGGPEGDNGLSGKKLVADMYGPRVPIGGGALSGKDFFKADRAGAIVARRLAKAVVVTGAAGACTATLAFVPGQCEARIVSLQHESGSRSILRGGHGSSICLSLLRAIATRVRPTSWTSRERGHFLNPALPWEQLGFDLSRKAPTGAR